MNTDVIIVGAGIAGLALSHLLQQHNINHKVLFSEGGAPDFALAETLPPSALPLLRKVGLEGVFREAAIQETYGYHSVWGAPHARDNNFFFEGGGHGLKVNKQAIVHSLRRQQSRHLVLCPGSPTISKTQGGYEVSCPQLSVTAPLIADATGRSRAVLRSLNIASVAYDDILAFSCHVPFVKHPALTHTVFIESFEAGWGIASRLNNAQNVITLFTSQDNPARPRFSRYEHWPQILSETTYLKDFLTSSHRVKIKGGKANSSKPRLIAGGNWLAVGDAATAFDPLSSHGITNALYTAQQAAAALASRLRGTEDALIDYGATMNAIFDQYIRARRQHYLAEHRWPDAPFWQKTVQIHPA